MSIPLMNPKAQYAPYIAELEEIAVSIIRSGNFILGEHVKAFEAEAAEFLGVKHAIGVANGTDALTIALRCLGVEAGDEVICPAYTFYATAETIADLGAIPVFADVDPVTWNLDVADVRARITGKTKAILPVHLFGQGADMEGLNALGAEHGIPVLEDSAQAWGARRNGQRIGALGDAATFSFFPSKNLPCFGDGGMITTNRDDVAEMARILRFHGSRDKATFEYVGYNSRLDELQAGFLRRHLKEIDGWNAKRREVAAWYEEAGLGDIVELPGVGEGNESIWHLYVVHTEHRDALIEGCKAKGVAASIYYGNPLHLQPVFAHLGYAQGDLPVTERLCGTGVAIPMFPTMTREQAFEVVEAIRTSVPAPVAG